MELDLTKINSQIHLASVFKSTEEIVQASQNFYFETLYEKLGERLMLTDTSFFEKLTTSKLPNQAIKCKLLTYENRVKIEGLLMGVNIQVVRYCRDQLRKEKNAIFLSYYLFEEHEIGEGEPAAIIKDITTSSKIFF
ncbi:MAG: hypothetical protein QXU74_02570 [Candidatus Aenigmatarchaeota archaeon]